MLSMLFFAPLIIIQNPAQYPLDEDRFSYVLNQAVAHFEQEIGPVSSPIKVSIAPPDCLRTGYNRRTSEVVFCPNDNVIEAGLRSEDVINHELFHAFLCQYKAELCQSDLNDDLHEALADVFAYQLNPDRLFGEKFYRTHPYMRTFDSSWREGLVKSEHEKGTALASRFIREKRTLKRLLPLFNQEKPSPEVFVSVEGREASQLNRYRLKKDEIMKLSFTFSPEANVTGVKWNSPQGVTIKSADNFQFDIQITSGPKQSKSLAIFLSQEGTELGRYSFYFGSEL